jgi:hypothetical protein
MYCEVEKRFCLPHFTFFLELAEDCNDALFLTRWIEPTTHIQYVAFNFGGKLYMLHATNSTTRIVSMETKEIYVEVLKFLKAQCSSAAIHLIIVLEKCFLAHELLNAIGVIYPWYWSDSEAKVTCPKWQSFNHTLGTPKPLGTLAQL